MDEEEMRFCLSLCRRKPCFLASVGRTCVTIVLRGRQSQLVHGSGFVDAEHVHATTNQEIKTTHRYEMDWLTQVVSSKVLKDLHQTARR